MNEKSKITAVAWRGLICAMAINLLGGAQFCWSLLGSTLIKEHGWTNLQASLPYSTMMIVTAFWAMVVGKITDKYGPNLPLKLGAVCECLALCIAGITDSWWMVMFAIGILLGIASTSITSNTASTAMKLMPPKYKGMASGIVTALFGWTSLYMSPLINKLLSVTSMKVTFCTIGIVCGVSIFILSFIIPNPIKYPELVVPVGKTEEEKDYSKYQNKISTISGALKTKEVWIIFFLFFCAGMAGQILVSQVSTIATVRAGAANTVIFVTLTSFMNGLGRFGNAALSDKIGIPNTWRTLFIGTIIGMIILFNAHNVPVMIFATIFIGFFFGGGVGVIWSTTAAVYGRKYVTSIYGFTTLGNSLAAFVGPTIASMCIDGSGDYTAAFITVVVFQVLGLIASFGIKDKYTEAEQMK